LEAFHIFAAEKKPRGTRVKGHDDLERSASQDGATALAQHLTVVEASIDQPLNPLKHPGHDRLQFNTLFSVEPFFFTDVINEARDVWRSRHMNLRLIQRQ
jgi:hypothetical protein